MPKHPSKYTQCLQELGFIIKFKRPRAMRRFKARFPPSFSCLQGITHATDDQGVTWTKDGIHDLTEFGFNNKSEEGRLLLEQAGLAKKPN